MNTKKGKGLANLERHCLPRRPLDTAGAGGKKLSDFKGISDEEESYNNKIIKYNSKWT